MKETTSALETVTAAVEEAKVEKQQMQVTVILSNQPTQVWTCSVSKMLQNSLSCPTGINRVLLPMFAGGTSSGRGAV